MYVTEQGILDERYDLAVERIRQITELLQNKPAEALQEAADPFSDYFAKVGSFILLMDRIRGNDVQSITIRDFEIAARESVAARMTENS